MKYSLFSAIPPTLTIYGGYLGYTYAKRIRKQRWHGYAHHVELNYGYVFYGGLFGYYIGKFTKYMLL